MGGYFPVDRLADRDDLMRWRVPVSVDPVPDVRLPDAYSFSEPGLVASLAYSELEIIGSVHRRLHGITHIKTLVVFLVNPCFLYRHAMGCILCLNGGIY